MHAQHSAFVGIFALVAAASACDAEVVTTRPTTTPATGIPTMDFTVEEVFYIKPPVDRVVLVGTISAGAVRIGDNLVVHTSAGPVSVAVDNILSIQRGDLKEARKGEQVGLQLRGIRKEQPSRGDRVSAATELPSATRPATGTTPAERIKLLRERIPEMPIIVLVKQPELSSHVLDVQDYVINGESVIPLFSTQAALTEALHGATLSRPTMAIARPLLASVLRGNEVLILDLQLPSQIRFTATEFREAFPEPLVLPATRPAK